MTGERPADAALETERCWIRNWRPEDADRVFDIYRRSEVFRWLGRNPQQMQSIEEARRLVERWAELNRDEPIARRWAVQRKADGVVAGESARALLGWGFSRALDEVLAVVRPDNAASLAVCRRLGMTALGRTTRYYDTELELFRVRPDAPRESHG